MSTPRIACIRFLDQKLKNSFKTVDDIYLKKGGTFLPKNCKDLDEKKLYSIYWCTCGPCCTGEREVCKDSHQNMEPESFYKGYIVCMGVSIEDCKAKFEERTSRIKFPLRLSSTDSDDSNNENSTQEEEKTRLKSLKKQIQQDNCNRVLDKYNNLMTKRQPMHLQVPTAKRTPTNECTSCYQLQSFNHSLQQIILDKDKKIEKLRSKVHDLTDLLQKFSTKETDTKKTDDGIADTGDEHPEVFHTNRSYTSHPSNTLVNNFAGKETGAKQCVLNSIGLSDANDSEVFNTKSDASQFLNNLDENFDENESDDTIAQKPKLGKRRYLLSTSSHDTDEDMEVCGGKTSPTSESSNTSVKHLAETEAAIAEKTPNSRRQLFAVSAFHGNEDIVDRGNKSHASRSSNILDPMDEKEMDGDVLENTYKNLKKYKYNIFSNYKKRNLFPKDDQVLQETHKRYEMVDGRVYIAPNITVGQKTWEMVKSKNKEKFIREIAILLWGKRNLANRALYLNRVTNNIPGRSPVKIITPKKLDLFLARRLNEYIRHYEPLSYDTQEIRRLHLRAKRSVTGNTTITLKFQAHGRNFQLRLQRDLNTFNSKLIIIGPSNYQEDLDTSHIYQGYLLGEPDSYVFGSLSDGVFHGKIVSPHKGSWYIEKAHYYFSQHKYNRSLHSIIYHENDVEDPYKIHRADGLNGCGITEEVTKWMNRIQNSALPDTPLIFEIEQMMSMSSLHEGDSWSNKDKFYMHKYSRDANSPDMMIKKTRIQRATRSKDENNNKNTCSLFIQTDPLIWRHIYEQLNHDEDKTREEILSLIAHHVTAVNYIYRDTKFDGKIEHRNIKFEVQRIKIDDDSTCGQSQNYGDQNPFCMENIDVSNFLNLHSLGNHEDFCLAYVFTYRDFTGGTLGLAWVASASGASGGICEKYKTYTETVGGMYQSTKRSLNTGIITFVNYNSRVPPKVSQLTLAHEIGHNFGSPHDFPAHCKPGGLEGNYIMFASATSGDRPNNSKFSKCSIGNISNVLDAIVDNKKRNCFNASAGAFCGNKIVEAGEECDCGYDDDECVDKCCYPRQVSVLDRIKNQTAKGCIRKNGAECSPSQGPCCSSERCSFVPQSENVQCKAESDCSYNSICNGRSSECPVPKPKANKTRCNEGTQLCINGECAGSICLEWNLTECFLSSNLIPNIDKRKLCELACQNGTDASTCRSTSEFAHLVNITKGGISLRPGSPCDNFQGYCDVFLKCRAVDAEGPLARLKNMLFNEQTLHSLAQWITDYWWAVLLMGIALIIVMGLFIKCCAVHTPSSNPKQPPARHISETLRRPMNTLRRMRYQYRGTGSNGGRSVSSRHNVHGCHASRHSSHSYGDLSTQYYPKGLK